MGGGAAMRAAAKVAGIGVVNGGLRGAGFTVVPPSSEQSVMRNASRPVSATLASVSQSEIDGGMAVQRPAWELDDWEFAGDEGDLMAVGSGGSESIARVVFGGPPSIEEAKDATSELKDAIDKVLLPSSMSNAPDGLFPAVHMSSSSLFSDADSTESKTCIAHEVRASPVPKAAMQAFSFLSQSPDAQSVVASVASDPNVWNAVMQNDALVEFLESNKESTATLKDAESIDENLKPSDESPSEDSGKKGNPWMGIVQDIKLKVAQMVSKVSGFIQNMFGSDSAEQTNCDSDDGKAKSSFFTDARTIMALAFAVIVVVILKRG